MNEQGDDKKKQIKGGAPRPALEQTINQLSHQVRREQLRADIAETVLKAQEKVVRHINEELTPIEVTTEVTNELTAKGDPKPSAKVRITRKLANGTDVREIVLGDLKLGEEETAAAIQKAVTVVAEEGGNE